MPGCPDAHCLYCCPGFPVGLTAQGSRELTQLNCLLELSSPAGLDLLPRETKGPGAVFRRLP